MSTSSALLLLTLLWLGYFGLHSLLAATSVKAALWRRWPGLKARYRLLFNVLAVILLGPPLALLDSHPGPLLWAWTGAAQWLSHAAAATAIAGVVLARTGYDLRLFLGIGGTDTASRALSNEGLRVSGIHRFVRHPWYFFALLLIWSRDMPAAMLLTALLLTLYFIVGSRLEETKLIDEYGDAYRRYRQRVPGLVPWPGKVLGVEEARRLERMGCRPLGSSGQSP